MRSLSVLVSTLCLLFQISGCVLDDNPETPLVDYIQEGFDSQVDEYIRLQQLVNETEKHWGDLRYRDAETRNLFLDGNRKIQETVQAILNNDELRAQLREDAELRNIISAVLRVQTERLENLYKSYESVASFHEAGGSVSDKYIDAMNDLYTKGKPGMSIVDLEKRTLQALRASDSHFDDLINPEGEIEHIPANEFSSTGRASIARKEWFIVKMPEVKDLDVYSLKIDLRFRQDAPLGERIYTRAYYLGEFGTKAEAKSFLQERLLAGERPGTSIVRGQSNFTRLETSEDRQTIPLVQGIGPGCYVAIQFSHKTDASMFSGSWRSARLREIRHPNSRGAALTPMAVAPKLGATDFDGGSVFDLLRHAHHGNLKINGHARKIVQQFQSYLIHLNYRYVVDELIPLTATDVASLKALRNSSDNRLVQGSRPPFSGNARPGTGSPPAGLEGVQPQNLAAPPTNASSATPSRKRVVPAPDATRFGVPVTGNDPFDFFGIPNDHPARNRGN